MTVTFLPDAAPWTWRLPADVRVAKIALVALVLALPGLYLWLTPPRRQTAPLIEKCLRRLGSGHGLAT
jgi:hypothetical protein